MGCPIPGTPRQVLWVLGEGKHRRGGENPERKSTRRRRRISSRLCPPALLPRSYLQIKGFVCLSQRRNHKANTRGASRAPSCPVPKDSSGIRSGSNPSCTACPTQERQPPPKRSPPGTPKTPAAGFMPGAGLKAWEIPNSWVPRLPALPKTPWFDGAGAGAAAVFEHRRKVPYRPDQLDSN